MASSIAWLDSTPEEQRAARELIAMFSDKESRDELGIGPIRDAFSDLLFPGTSVLQTRARYYLFVPWCYLTADVHRLPGAKQGERGRQNERQLIGALRSSGAGDLTGLIGARAGGRVRNLPSDVFWNGLLRYGIRTHPGPIGSLALAAGDRDGATELAEREPSEWVRTIPPAPAGFPQRVDGGFSLTADEAGWLRERIVASTEGTLLAALLEQNAEIPGDLRAPWEASSEAQFEELGHARRFSWTMQGAALLYNLLIAEKHERAGLGDEAEDLVDGYQESIEEWRSALDTPSFAADFRGWDIDRMWEIVGRTSHNIHPRTKAFVTDWITGMRTDTGQLAGNEGLRGLVAEREKRKGAQSRLKNDRMLAAWSGASGTGRMTYRWDRVKVIVNDIVRGLSHAGT